jgi:hypothetical protein
LIVCVMSFALATFCTTILWRDVGPPLAIASWCAVNLATALFWSWLVFYITVRLHRERPPG